MNLWCVFKINKNNELSSSVTTICGSVPWILFFRRVGHDAAQNGDFSYFFLFLSRSSNASIRQCIASPFQLMRPAEPGFIKSSKRINFISFHVIRRFAGAKLSIMSADHPWKLNSHDRGIQVLHTTNKQKIFELIRSYFERKKIVLINVPGFA